VSRTRSTSLKELNTRERRKQRAEEEEEEEDPRQRWWSKRWTTPEQQLRLEKFRKMPTNVSP
jgi:hypothetical protein